MSTPTQPPAPTPAGFGAVVKDLATPVATVFTLIGALWFGVLSLSVTIAYAPVGVTPREVGLASGAVLAQAGAGFAALFVAGLLYLGLAAAMLFRRAARPEALARRVRLLLGVAVILGLTVCAFTLVNAFNARVDLHAGRTPASSGLLPVPWRAETADVQWAGAAGTEPADLPACGLYLGQDGATAMLYVADDDGDNGPHVPRTFRLPAASLSLTLQPDRASCASK